MTNQPKRIQLSRKKGWRMPPNTVSVARPHKWGNPFKVGDPEPVHCGPMSAQEAVFWFKSLFHAAVSKGADELIAEARSELRDKNLACWCKPGEPCHADVLLEIANGEERNSEN